MDNKKIPTKLGVIIIILFTITAIAFILIYESNYKVSTIMSNHNIASDTDQNYQLQGKKIAESGIVQGAPDTDIGTIMNGLYTNVKYAYKINIPENFDIDRNGPAQDQTSLIRIFLKTDKPFLFSIHASHSEFKNVDGWFKSYEQNLSKTSSYEGVEIKIPSIVSKERINVDRTEAIRIVLDNMPFSNYLIVFIKNNFIYTVSYNGFLTEEEDIIFKRSTNKKEVLKKFQFNHRRELNEMIDSLIFTK